MTFAKIEWDGGEVGATLVCSCGAETFSDIRMRDFIECSSCHKAWKPLLCVSCEAVTEEEATSARKKGLL